MNVCRQLGSGVLNIRCKEKLPLTSPHPFAIRVSNFCPQGSLFSERDLKGGDYSSETITPPQGKLLGLGRLG